MEKTGLSMHGLFPVARFFLQFSDEIIVNNVYSLSPKPSSTKDTSDDQTGWLEVFSKCMATEMSTLKNEISRAVEKKMNIRKKRILDLNPRQQKLLRHLQYNPRVSRRKYVAMTGVSSMTAYRDLNDLVKRKLIHAYGGGRSSYYRLAGRSEEEHTLDHTKKREVVKIITDDGLSYLTRRESDPTFLTSDQSDI